MVAHVTTVAFSGIEAVPVDVQIQIATGIVAFTIVGLPDKAVAESRERVRSALHAVGIGLPARKIVINLAPADLPKEGSHYDLPIAVSILAALDILPKALVARYLFLGELSLDGALAPVSGVLPAAMKASEKGLGIVCPKALGSEAAWAGEHLDIVAPETLVQLINHFKHTQILSRPLPSPLLEEKELPDLRDIKGQEAAKRALEVAAAGGHHFLMIGPPGAGKSMLARRLPSILPPMDAQEMLEISMISSVAGELVAGAISARRPFRDPHHSASQAALTGGGFRAKPGEMSLAHNGVLFLDELPEFQPRTLEALRQPMETGQTVVARANYHVTYPARFQLIAAMNPCRCGGGMDGENSCKRGPRCQIDYQSRISGPLLDRMDLQIELPAVKALDLIQPPPKETSKDVAERVAAARLRQKKRYAQETNGRIMLNAQADGNLLEKVACLDESGQTLLHKAADKIGLSARGFHRVLKVSRTIADLAGREQILRIDVAEALSYRQMRANFSKDDKISVRDWSAKS